MRNALFASAAVVGLLTSASAFAQATAPSSEAAATGSEEANVASGDIIVTAQKREERLRDVPLAVSAYTSAALQSQQITTATDLRLISPSLNFTPSANARGEGFAIRGVGTAIFSDTVEQSVGVVVDGVVLGRSGQATGDLLDLERVEVLRGPQGMLFGKNASAGLISITTRRPPFAWRSGGSRLMVRSTTRSVMRTSTTATRLMRARSFSGSPTAACLFS
jgi:iron complex outermembrane receptor protein